MKTETIALLISIFSIAVAATALGWNIYRDIVLKPRLRTHCGIKLMFDPTTGLGDQQFFVFTATNFGPGKLNLNTLLLKETSVFKKLFRKQVHAFIPNQPSSPQSTRLPCEIDVGKDCTIIMNEEESSFLNDSYTHIGISDTFGRTHWCKKSFYRNAMKEFKADEKKS